jgi:hypothetical protein
MYAKSVPQHKKEMLAVFVLKKSQFADNGQLPIRKQVNEKTCRFINFQKLKMP